MSIATIFTAVKTAERHGLQVEIVDQPGGDLLVQVYPPKVGDDYHWCYSDTFEQVDTKAITAFILKAVEEDSLHQNMNK
jgi:hypothetical protein